MKLPTATFTLKVVLMLALPEPSVATFTKPR